MIKYIIVFVLSFSIAYSQSYKEVLDLIRSNNKEIKSYKEYLNSLNIESNTNNLPLNPSIEYSYLSPNESSLGNKQELIISQSFEFPTVYFLKSDISSIQSSVNLFKLKDFEKNIINVAQSRLIEYIYLRKKVDELFKRFESAENMLNTVQIKFDKGDVGILELNKSKSALSIAKSKLTLADIELNSTLAELVNLNGGLNLTLNFSDYEQFEINTNFDSLFTSIKKADYYNKSLEEDKKLSDKKLSLAKSGWLPDFGIGYRQDTENDFKYNGVMLQMSIPIFENTNKVPLAESELNLADLKIQSYNSKFYLDNKMLFDKSIQLRKSLDEQIVLIDYTQLELNRKSYELGQISLTQFYIDNTIYYEIVDTILEMEMEYNKIIGKLMINLFEI